MEFLIFLLIVPLLIGGLALTSSRRRPGARGPEGSATFPDEARGIADTNHRQHDSGPGGS